MEQKNRTGSGGLGGTATQQAQEPNATLGRIVVYNSRNPGYGQCPAIVQAVELDGDLRLCVFGPRGVTIEENVPQGTNLGEWNWPSRV